MAVANVVSSVPPGRVVAFDRFQQSDEGHLVEVVDVLAPLDEPVGQRPGQALVVGNDEAEGDLVVRLSVGGQGLVDLGRRSVARGPLTEGAGDDTPEVYRLVLRRPLHAGPDEVPPARVSLRS